MTTSKNTMNRTEIFKTLMAELGMSSTVESLVNGKLVQGSGDLIRLEDPYSREILCEYADCGAALANQACDAAANQRLKPSPN